METVDPRVQFIMIKGEPGTRKSTQALSYPGSQYWFSWDQKMQGLLIPMLKWGIDPSKVHYDDYSDWSKAAEKLKQLQVNCPYDSLIFDSITSCGDMALRQVLKMKGGTKRGSGQDAGKVIGGIEVNEMEDFNAESSALTELIALTKDIQSYNKSKGRYINIIIIAHVLETFNKVGNKLEVNRTIVTAGKKVAAKLPAYCSEVYHFGMKKAFQEGQSGELICLTENTGQDFARTALPLPKEIAFGDSPLYDTYILPAIKKLEGEKTTTTTPQTQPTPFKPQ